MLSLQWCSTARPADTDIDMEYVSEIIREDSGAYIRRRTWRRLRQWLWLIVAVLAATSVAACFDFRFLYVLLIEIFIVFPMALGPVWLSECFNPYTRRMLTPYRVTLSDSGLTIDYLPPEGHAALDAEKFGWNAFASYHDAGKSVILNWNGTSRPGLRLPEYAYDAAAWQEVARILARNL